LGDGQSIPKDAQIDACISPSEEKENVMPESSFPPKDFYFSSFPPEDLHLMGEAYMEARNCLFAVDGRCTEAAERQIARAIIEACASG
jgi:hypothetical protein